MIKIIIIVAALFTMGGLLSNYTHAYNQHCLDLKSSIGLMKKDINSQLIPSEHDTTHLNDVIDELNEWCTNGVS